MKPTKGRFIKPAVAWMILLALTVVPARAELREQQLEPIEFEQKLGQRISLNLTFQDETGETVDLSRYFDEKPVILVLGYYECPMLCGLVLNGLVESLHGLSWDVGEQFEIVCVSIDPEETPELAAAKKRNYLKRYGREGAAEGWHFLTATNEAPARLAEEVGFHYAYDKESEEYAHPSGLVLLTPEGKTARYLFGIDYSSKDLMDGLTLAKREETGSPARQLLLLCFRYNPLNGKYGALIMKSLRIGGVLTLAGIAALVGGYVFKEKREVTGGTPGDDGAANV